MTDNISNTSLASTARWTASARALESARADALFHDPWAAELAGEEGQRWIAQRNEFGVVPILLRTRYFDDFLQRVAQENSVRQVVLMAAGLDTRAFRLSWPQGTRLFELDQLEVLSYKDEILQAADARPTCDRFVIPANLAEPWQEKLVESGFDPRQLSVWLLEGFLFYLSSDVVVSLLNQVNDLASPESWLGFDIINNEMLTSPLTRSWVEMQAATGAPWIGVLDDPQAFLTERGWQAYLTQAGQPDANHGRWNFPVLPTAIPGVPHNWFVTAIKI